MKKNNVIIPDDSNLIQLGQSGVPISRDQWNQPAQSKRKKREEQQQRTEDLRRQNEKDRMRNEEERLNRERMERISGLIKICHNHFGIYGSSKGQWRVYPIDNPKEGGTAVLFMVNDPFECGQCGAEFSVSSNEAKGFMDDHGVLPCPICGGDSTMSKNSSVVSADEGRERLMRFVEDVKQLYPNSQSTEIQEGYEPHRLQVVIHDDSWKIQ